MKLVFLSLFIITCGSFLYAQAPSELCMYSPILYVDSAAVPTIIFHGTKDKVVPIEQSKQLQKLLTNNNVENEFMIVEKGDHGFNNISREETDALVSKTVDYIIRHTRDSR